MEIDSSSEWHGTCFLPWQRLKSSFYMREADESTVDAMPLGDSEGATVWWPSRHEGETLEVGVRKIKASRTDQR